LDRLAVFLLLTVFLGLNAEDSLNIEVSAGPPIYDIPETEGKMPFLNIDIGDIPIFMNIYDAEPVYVYERADFTGEYKNILHFDNMVIPSFCYSSYYSDYYSAYDGLFSFISEQKTDTFFYDISLYANKFSNRIYASLDKGVGDTRISGFSYFNLYSDRLNYYNTFLKGSYKGYLIQIDASGDAKMASLGYENKYIHFDMGYSSGVRFPINTYLNYKSMLLIAKTKIGRGVTFTDNYFLAAYYVKAGIFSVMPMAIYTDSLFASIPLSAEIFKGFYITASGEYSNEEIFASAGIKYANRSIFINGGMLYGSIGKRAKYRASGLADFKLLNAGANLAYDTLLEYNVHLHIKYPLYHGHLIPGMLVDYDGSAAGTFLTIHLLDSEIFFGSDWNLFEKTYILSGGIQWKFAE